LFINIGETNALWKKKKKKKNKNPQKEKTVARLAA